MHRTKETRYVTSLKKLYKYAREMRRAVSERPHHICSRYARETRSALSERAQHVCSRYARDTRGAVSERPHHVCSRCGLEHCQPKLYKGNRHKYLQVESPIQSWISEESRPPAPSPHNLAVKTFYAGHRAERSLLSASSSYLASSGTVLMNQSRITTDSPISRPRNSLGFESHRGLKTLANENGVTGEKIKEFLGDNNMPYEAGHTCFITTCPRHTRKRILLKEVDKLYVNSTTGYFVCHSCKKCGPWTWLQDNVAMLREKKRKPQHCFVGIESIEKESGVKRARDLYDESQPLHQVAPHVLQTLKDNLDILELHQETLEKYHVRVTINNKGLVLPSVNFDGTLLGCKVITYHHMDEDDPDSQVKVTIKSVPRVDYHGLLGWHTLNKNRLLKGEVALTASELDALACHQETGITTLALPKGDQTLPQQVLPLLEQFSKIILWLGGDMHTWETAKQFAKKLGDKRCFLVRPDSDQPSAMVALRREMDLRHILSKAKAMKHESIVTFSGLKNEVYSELKHFEQIAGVKWKRYPQLNKLLKGHRRGELTVFTGPTGSGKTTFMSDYSLDLCMQGVNTLWGSFEINNVRLVRTMLQQYAGLNLSKHLDQFEEHADRFEQLPMYFMTFHGQESMKKVIDTMAHAVYVYDIAHVIMDNLQFMMGTSTSVVNADRFTRQDLVIESLRKFATHMNCHVTLVIHPRKEKAEEDLTISSIFGGAKATQESDNVLILQDKRLTSVRGKKFLQVVKNRYDGELGIMLLKFDKNSLSFQSSVTKDKVKEKEPTEEELTEKEQMEEEPTEEEPTEKEPTEEEPTEEEPTEKEPTEMKQLQTLRDEYGEEPANIFETYEPQDKTAEQLKEQN